MVSPAVQTTDVPNVQPLLPLLPQLATEVLHDEQVLAVHLPQTLPPDLPLLEKVQPELPVEPQLATDWYDVEYPVGQVAALQIP